jgi:Relaxase/Mobilisation nuclease domain/Large polyvalent protein-associated domain 7
MIAKHVAMNSAKKSNFAELVRYITDGQGKEERISDVSVTNCQSDRVDAAILEVINTQGKNTRATSDKTFHLLVSFPPGEEPDGAVLKASERKLCEGIGFGCHQRVSALHTDTDSLHLHIAINKIHPTRYTIYEPYNVYHTLGLFCERLEHEYGLTLVNHTSKKTLSEDHATDMEHHAGIESLLGWIKRECLDQIQAAQSWEALHQAMQVNGLHLHERGNGLVIAALDGTTVKASSVGRDFSKNKLEARFGAFEPSPEQANSDRATKNYEQKPMRSRVDTAVLYARYKHEMSVMNPLRAAELSRAIQRKKRLIEDAKRSGRLKRATLKLIKGQRTAKRILYAQISLTLKDEISKINKSYLNGRQAIYLQYTRLAWADWLKQQAISGDQEALGVLRGRLVTIGLKGNTVGGDVHHSTQGFQAEQDNITKKGTVFYRVGKTIIRDDGERLKVGKGVTQANLQTVLMMAMERYGQHIKVNGSADFKEQVIQAATAANLPITFDDVDLARRYQAIMNSNTNQEHGDEQKPTSGNRGRNDRGGNGGTRPAPTRTLPKRFPSFNKPDLGRVGSRPPPESQNLLRGLSTSTNEVKCYCRVMFLVTWSNKEPNQITACDGMLLGQVQ